jgi:hypothetical protein
LSRSGQHVSLGNVDLTSSFSSQVAAAVATKYDAARQEFLALFPRRDAFIWKLFGYERWQKAKGPLLDSQITGVISDDGRGLYRGCYWAHKTRHAVLDIDSQSKYHNAAELKKLKTHLSNVGLYVISYQSSDSGGWHVYLFFEDWADSDEVSQTLKRLLKGLGYEIASGVLEVFPSGNALRLPLQQGFGWLGPEGNLVRKRGEIQEDQALALFLSDLNSNACNWQDAKTLIERQLGAARAAAGENERDEDQAHHKAINTDGFEQLFSKGLIPEKWEKGRQFWLNGLTEKDQRHEALLAVGHYLWYGDADAGLPAYPGRFNDQTRARLIRIWLEQKHNGFSGHVRSGNWQAIDADLQRAVTWRQLQDLEHSNTQHIPYGLIRSEAAQDRMVTLSRATGRTWSPEDWKKGNDKREKQARRKIKRAIANMLAAGEQLTRNAIAKHSGCSPNTVSKHRDLWHLLPSRSGDLSRGVWGVSSVRAVPEVGSEDTAIKSSAWSAYKPKLIKESEALAVSSLEKLEDWQAPKAKNTQAQADTGSISLSCYVIALAALTAWQQVPAEGNEAQLQRPGRARTRAARPLQLGSLSDWVKNGLMPEEKIEQSQPLDQGAEKKALSTADANAARNASASQVSEVQSTNPNKFESMTQLPTIKDGMSLEEAQQSFGINMGDDTAVTAKGVEAPAKKKVSIDPRPSYVEGLKVVGKDEEAQGRFSIEYMERKAKEALAALQKPPAEQVLIASNITPVVPNLEQLQQYQDIQSDSVVPTPEQIAEREKDLAKNEKPRLIPKDGQKLTLTELLEEYKTPFIDAYERSHRLEAGQPGYSKTLNDTVDRLSACPWSDKIRIKFDKNAANPEYDPKESTITINPNHSPMRQIEEFVHEGYHATHQGIGAMYINKATALSPEKYFNVRADGEVGSFLAEIKVNAELQGGTPIEFEHVVNGKAVKENLSAFKDEAKLRSFLLDAKPVLYRNGKAQVDFFQNLQTAETYRQHYENSYGDYKQTFEQAKPQAGAVLKDYQKKNPGKSAADFINDDY